METKTKQPAKIFFLNPSKEEVDNVNSRFYSKNIFFNIKINKNFIIILIFSFVILVSLVTAEDQSVRFSYSFTNNTSYESTISFSDFLLKLTTDNNAICHFSNTLGTSYANMDGNFDITSGKSHEKSFINLGDGVYKYCVKCIPNPTLNQNFTEPSETDIIIRVDSLPTCSIVLPDSNDSAPLRAGKYNLMLITSKIVPNAPSLSYTYDGIVYNELPLYGSGTIWKGYLIIPRDAGESVLSFKFSSNDLEGRAGNIISSGGVVSVDTLKPAIIYSIDAIGYQGRIELKLDYNEKIKEFKTYRSTSPGVDYVDFYKSFESVPFEDSDVENGKTYYYKVSAIDEAGNEADLSKEVSATALLENSSSSVSNGLSIELQGSVDNLLTEIQLILSDIKTVQSSISSKSEKEKTLFSDLSLNSEINSAESQISSLSKDVERLKLQDLPKEQLNSKIDSSRLKLNVIKQSVPESIIVSSDDSKTESINDADIQSTILQIEPTISDSDKDKSFSLTKKFIKDSNLKITSTYSILQISYLDGTKKDLSLIKRAISGEVERDPSHYFIEIIPKDIAQKSSDINFETPDYHVVKEDPIISFGTDNKQIIFSLNKKLSISDLETVKPVFVAIYRNNQTSGENSQEGITGYLIAYSSKSYFGPVIAILIAGSLIYLFILKKNKPTDSFLNLVKKLEEAVEYLKNNNIRNAKEIYNSINKNYKELGNREKKKIYMQIGLLKEKILVLELRNGLNSIKENRNKDLFNILEKIYESLSKESKSNISELFKKVKEDYSK